MELVELLHEGFFLLQQLLFSGIGLSQFGFESIEIEDCGLVFDGKG